MGAMKFKRKMKKAIDHTPERKDAANASVDGITPEEFDASNPSHLRTLSFDSRELIENSSVKPGMHEEASMGESALNQSMDAGQDAGAAGKKPKAGKMAITPDQSCLQVCSSLVLSLTLM